MRPWIPVLLCAGAAYAAERMVGGPYVVTPASRSATIGWVTTDGEVKTGSAPGRAGRAIPALRSQKVSMTGLKPGETVYYEIPGDAPLAERQGRFKTPPTGRASFNFVVFGDTRTRDDLHRRIIQGIVKTEPDFVIHTGDLVSDGYDTTQWPTFFDIEREMLRKTVFFPVLGNHERNNARFHEFFDVKTPYYSFNWGGVHVVILNSDLSNVSISAAERERFWTEQTRWMEDDLERSQKADFRLVAMHHPPFTAYDQASHLSKETPGLVPLFEKYKVAAVFAGHDHNYQHHVKNGVHYVITGGGGAPLANVNKPIPDITRKVESIEHFVTVKVEGTKLRTDAVTLDGRVIETIEIAVP